MREIPSVVSDDWLTCFNVAGQVFPPLPACFLHCLRLTTSRILCAAFWQRSCFRAPVSQNVSSCRGEWLIEHVYCWAETFKIILHDSFSVWLLLFCLICVCYVHLYFCVSVYCLLFFAPLHFPQLGGLWPSPWSVASLVLSCTVVFNIFSFDLNKLFFFLSSVWIFSLTSVQLFKLFLLLETWSTLFHLCFMCWTLSEIVIVIVNSDPRVEQQSKILPLRWADMH